VLLPYRICGEVATPTISLRLEGVICMHGQEGSKRPSTSFLL